MVNKPFTDVARCIREKKNTMVGPTLALVVNFCPAAAQPAPVGGQPSQNPLPQYSRRFLYPICTRVIERGWRLMGRTCGKSLEFGQQCKHDSFARGTFAYVYRFDVFLIEAIPNGEIRPMRCRISEAASVLLGVSAMEFSELTEKEQLELVTTIIRETPMYNFDFKVTDRDVTADILTTLGPVRAMRQFFARLGRGPEPIAEPMAEPRMTVSCVPRISLVEKNKGKENIVEEHSDTDLMLGIRGSPTLSRQHGPPEVRVSNLE